MLYGVSIFFFKLEILPSCIRVNTIVWLHHLDSNKMLEKKKLDGNYIRMLEAVLNKSWKQHPSKQQLFGHLPPILQATQISRTRYAGQSLSSKDEQHSPMDSYIYSCKGYLTSKSLHRFCALIGYSVEDLPRVMHDRNGLRDRDREKDRNRERLRALSTTRWWRWCLFIQLFARKQEMSNNK